MPAVKNVGEPCAGEPHARFDGGREETSDTRPRRATPGASRLPDHAHRCEPWPEAWTTGLSFRSSFREAHGKPPFPQLAGRVHVLGQVVEPVPALVTAVVD